MADDKTGAKSVDEEKATKTPEQIRAEIEATREELGDTVEALAAKSDVKGRAQSRVEEIKADAKAKTEDVKAKVKSAAGGDDSGPTDPNAPTTGEKVQSGANQAVEKAKANPLPIAVGAALLVGYLIGKRVNRY